MQTLRCFLERWSVPARISDGIRRDARHMVDYSVCDDLGRIERTRSDGRQTQYHLDRTLCDESNEVLKCCVDLVPIVATDVLEGRIFRRAIPLPEKQP